MVKKVEEEIANLERHRDDLWMEARAGEREVKKVNPLPMKRGLGAMASQ